MADRSLGMLSGVEVTAVAYSVKIAAYKCYKNWFFKIFQDILKAKTKKIENRIKLLINFISRTDGRQNIKHTNSESRAQKQQN